ncbi:L-lactate dehydrogenase [Planctomycetes bacterium K23_9]|uniref:L-lactate dehydrogenase n=1 Tax=Stieleria marina TaxID=1930275 RepID=A0A517NZZ6_9BACT|nr:L-lactate dehydrogenase [Planctomycetes bacterium K23_9]
MKVSVVGSGFVGSTAAYAMVMQGIGREIVLVDHDKARAVAEAADIAHAVPFANPLTIRAGEYSDLEDSCVVIIAAGVGQKPGETRLQLLQRNADVFRDCVPQIVQNAPGAVLLVATNPVDIMTHIAGEIAAECGVPTSRVIGSGTTLDTARFRTLVGRHFGIDSRHVHSHVIGEHGDSEVLTWSLATIAGLSLQEFSEVSGTPLGDDAIDTIDEQVRKAAYRIIEGKGATHYGIGSALARIVDVIIHDQRSILTICSRIENVAGVSDVTISMPHLLGGKGVMASIPLMLDDGEQARLRASATIIRDAIDSISLTI